MTMRLNSVSCQLSDSMMTRIATTWKALVAMVSSVLVNARCAPSTSLSKRDISAPVFVWVKKRSDMRCMCAYNALRKSAMTPSPTRAEIQR